MNQFPPGHYIATAMNRLPPPGPDLPPQTVEIDAGPRWGRYRVTFAVKRNPRQGMRDWFWVMDTGTRLDAGG